MRLLPKSPAVIERAAGEKALATADHLGLATVQAISENRQSVRRQTRHVDTAALLAHSDARETGAS